MDWVNPSEGLSLPPSTVTLMMIVILYTINIDFDLDFIIPRFQLSVRNLRLYSNGGISVRTGNRDLNFHVRIELVTGLSVYHQEQ